MDTADILQIHEIIYRYAKLADDGDLEALGSLLSRCELYAGDNLICSRDPEKLAIIFKQAQDPVTGTPRVRHVTTNIVIDPLVNGEAKVASYFIAVNINPAHPLQVTMAGTYQDLFRRTQGGWMLVRRAIHIEHRAD